MIWFKKNWFKILAAVFLLGALGSHPYGYYQILRWVVCAVAAYVAFSYYHEKKMGWAWIFGTVAILFNPIFPFELQKSAWGIIDIAVALAFLIPVLIGPRRGA